MSKPILITNATGKQGSGVITALLAAHWPGPLLAATRDATSPAAQRLTSQSKQITLITGSLSDIPSLFTAATAALSPNQKIWGVYSVQVSLGPGITESSEIAEGTNLIDAAVAAGVHMFVYSSVDRGGDAASWDTETPIPHFRSKFVIERHLREATRPGAAGEAMKWTILRPVAFMENLKPGFETAVFLAALRNKVGDSKSVQWIAASDVGVFAALAFARPDKWHRRAVGLAGDELTMGGLREAFVAATGKPAPVAYWLFGSLLTAVARELRLMLEWFGTHGYAADVGGRRAEYPGLMTLEEWLRRNEAWQAVAVK
jgi:uncharacterized protein YbjT (DUF2867 family)